MAARRHDLLALRAAGHTVRQIAHITGLSISCVHARLTGKVAKPRKKAEVTERKCMCCIKPFLSEGPHNRLCNACRRRSAGPFETPCVANYR